MQATKLFQIIDARNYKSYASRPQCRKLILELMDNFELVDVWREAFPEKKGFTWRRFNSIQQSRLDYFLVSDVLLSDIVDVKIIPGYRSDHSIATIGLKFDTVKKKNKQYWKFNNSLLKDKEYVDIIKQLIFDIKKQYAVPVYNFNFIKDILDEHIAFVINDQLFF